MPGIVIRAGEIEPNPKSPAGPSHVKKIPKMARRYLGGGFKDFLFSKELKPPTRYILLSPIWERIPRRSTKYAQQNIHVDILLYLQIYIYICLYTWEMLFLFSELFMALQIVLHTFGCPMSRVRPAPPKGIKSQGRFT